MTRYAWVCPALLVALLVGCASYTPAPRKPQEPPKPQEPTRQPQDAAPHISPQVEDQLARLPDPDIKKETPSKRGNGPLYTVFGKSYRVMEQAEGFRQQGLASWYGTKFHGQPTSSGEPYDVYQLTAAHKHLPIPSYVRVTNLSNGRHTVVRVNDRGPFHDDRIIDLSYAAAVKLDFHNQGTTQVLVEVVASVQRATRFIVQAGAFREFQHADRSHKDLQRRTDVPGVIVKNSDGLYRVQLGPVAEGRETEQLRALLLAANYGPPKLIPAP